MGGASMKAWQEVRQKNVVYYGLSPFEQKAFPNFSKEFAKDFKRLGKQALLLAPFVIGSITLINWATAENKRFHRKNPADYLPGATPSHH